MHFSLYKDVQQEARVRLSIEYTYWSIKQSLTTIML